MTTGQIHVLGLLSLAGRAALPADFTRQRARGRLKLVRESPTYAGFEPLPASPAGSIVLWGKVMQPGREPAIASRKTFFSESGVPMARSIVLDGFSVYMHGGASRAAAPLRIVSRSRRTRRVMPALVDDRCRKETIWI